jgi:hypothetical protein
MERTRTQTEVRGFWDGVHGFALMHANSVGLKYDYAEDCAQDFITKKLRELINPLRCADSEQALWTRYALDGVNSAALVLELGRSDDALRQAICRIRKRIACLMAGVGMDAVEIADYQSLLGMYRSAH